MLDLLRLHADQIDCLCLPGEQPRAVGGVMYHAGVERLGGRADPRWRDVSFDPLSGLQSDRAEQTVERLVGGSTLRGHPGCRAIGLRDAVDAPGFLPHLLVTDRRLLAVHLADEPTVLWDADRPEVAGVRRRRHWLQAGRVEVAFTDGSSVRLMAGILLARRAKRLAAAW